MAIYRQIHVSFWQDAFVLDLTPEEKYFYIYLMTNSKTSQCGIYELPKRIIETDTGYNRETVDKLLNRFIDYGKILYCEQTKEIIMLNWLKHNSINSPKVQACVLKELKNVKNKEFVRLFHDTAIQYAYSIDTLSIDYGEEKEEEQEKEEEKNKNNIRYSEIVSYLNQKTNQSYKPTSKKTQQCIKARFNEGFTIADFKIVIDKKSSEWLNDPKMVQYLRPETLFGTKFESYLNQPTVIQINNTNKDNQLEKPSEPKEDPMAYFKEQARRRYENGSQPNASIG